MMQTDKQDNNVLKVSKSTNTVRKRCFVHAS